MTPNTQPNLESTTSTVPWSFTWLFYQRPSKSLKTSEKIDYLNCVKGSCANFTAAGIPDRLSLDKILKSETSSPCSLSDFLNYLRYIEHSPEHLEFYLWHDDYVKRFEALSDEEKARAPVWDTIKPGSPSKEDFSGVVTIRSNSTISRDSSLDEKDALSSGYHSKKHSFVSEEVSKQPFREEISRIIARYVVAGGARELNISSRDRETALQALSYTTHPSAVANLKADCDNYLRHQSHPNFIRWVIANCTTPRVNFAYSVGIGCMLIGIFVSLLLTLTSSHRAWRLFGALFWLIGVAILICGWKGICLVLMAMGHRRLLEPWEISYEDLENDKGSMTGGSSFEDVIPDSWDDAPWMQREKKKSWVRKVFGATVRVEDEQVRRIQDIILLQGAGLAILGTLPFLAIFLSIPPGHLF
ncbi:hypothetical protein ABW19_dt0208902 [Dactylella cylindrospora]|nr:hypothetical protein ABW19_dt0208902 [Dactylella cylindrospora]